MKVVLLKRIDKLGSAGEVKEVSDGFASNYLIPQGMVKPASGKVIKQVENQVEAQRKKDEESQKMFKEIAKKIDGKEFEIAKKSEKGKLFGSVKEKEVIDLIGEKDLQAKSINFVEPIKETGEFEVEVNISTEAKAKIKLIVKEL